MRIGTGVNTYEWQENWVKYPASESLSSGWSHHGVAISETGDIITYHPADPTVMIFDKNNVCHHLQNQMVIYNHILLPKSCFN